MTEQKDIDKECGRAIAVCIDAGFVKYEHLTVWGRLAYYNELATRSLGVVHYHKELLQLANDLAAEIDHDQSR